VRTLELPATASPREWGRIHGEQFRTEVAALAKIRLYLCAKLSGFSSEDQVLAAAAAHIPVLAQYDKSVHDELVGIAEGAGLSPEAIVVANHYTDLRDLDPKPGAWQPAPTHDDAAVQPSSTGAQPANSLPGDGCTVLWAESPTGRILAQTWDMHATAIPYVMVLAVPESATGPGARLLTVTGCLGMAGMNSARVGLAINNLHSTDATLGVVWPAIVRRALRERTATAARDVIAGSPIGSGRHYMVADPTSAFAIEASGRRRKQVFAGGPSYCHTNHCLDPDIAARSNVPGSSTTFARMRWLQADLQRAPVADLEDAWQRLGSDDGSAQSLCTNLSTPDSPHGAATCGAIAMNLDTGMVWVQQGLIHRVAPERWPL